MRHAARAAGTYASMEPPCEHGGVRATRTNEAPQRIASMEPPCEHGGVALKEAMTMPLACASMEPPCEHGGVRPTGRRAQVVVPLLQWSRRVNTAECVASAGSEPRGAPASMEPPCEHGGV